MSTPELPPELERLLDAVARRLEEAPSLEAVLRDLVGGDGDEQDGQADDTKW
jgi:hypothetical protein